MGSASNRRTAIVLFNLGGPDRLESVEPFLVNLFSDPAIIALPQPFRFLLARLIGKRRAPIARAIYDKMGGGSPLVENTEAQARALETALGAETFRCFVAMRYWHPFAIEAARAVKDWTPDRILLLPLYPQYSSTTTGSSLVDWHKAARSIGLVAPTRTVCCYPTAAGWIEALAQSVVPLLPAAREKGEPRLLFSAHGLPKKIVDAGDPYQWQVERTAEAVARRLEALGERVEWLVSYQSRVGPLKWLAPATDAEITRAGTEGRPLIICPIAFVSEHSETLVELDIEYRHLADKAGVPAYLRAPTVGASASFIAALAALAKESLVGQTMLMSQNGSRLCPDGLGKCACARSE